jgi:hypothetical protein
LSERFLACGSVVLGVHVRHALCDGEGFFQMMKDLAELYRTGGLQVRPHVVPYRVELFEKKQQPRRLEQQRCFHLCLQDSNASSASTGQQDVVVGRVIRFSSESLQRLKRMASEGATDWVSTFDALAAHLWRRLYVARVKEHKGQIANLSRDFLTSVNWRQRFGLSSHYFPNAVFAPFMTCTHEQLTEAPLSSVARMVHQLSRSLSQQDANDLLQWIASAPDKSLITNGCYVGDGSFLLSQWSKFGAYDIWFDEFGKPLRPTLVAPPFTTISLIDGLGYLVEQPGSGGAAIDLHLALKQSVWHIVEEDELLHGDVLLSSGELPCTEQVVDELVSGLGLEVNPTQRPANPSLGRAKFRNQKHRTPLKKH